MASFTPSQIVTLYRDRSLYVWDIADLQRIGKYRSFLYHSACICAIEVPLLTSSTIILFFIGL